MNIELVFITIESILILGILLTIGTIYDPIHKVMSLLLTILGILECLVGLLIIIGIPTILVGIIFCLLNSEGQLSPFRRSNG